MDPEHLNFVRRLTISNIFFYVEYEHMVRLSFFLLLQLCLLLLYPSLEGYARRYYPNYIDQELYFPYSEINLIICSHVLIFIVVVVASSSSKRLLK